MKNNKISISRLFIQMLYLILFAYGLISHKYIMLFIMITAVLLGPIFCGWMCFVGFYQDICRYLGRLIKKEPFEISEKLHSILKYSRYLILLGTIMIGGAFLFPGKIWHKVSELVRGNFIIDLAFYCVILLGFVSLFTKRFFCRYFCAFGAKLGLFALLRLITINRKKTCVSCGLCNNECLMKIEVEKINSLANPNCVNCLKCVECCPNNSLKIGLRNYLRP